MSKMYIRDVVLSNKLLKKVYAKYRNKTTDDLMNNVELDEYLEQAEKVFQAQEEAAEKDRRERSAQFAKEQISKSKRASTSRNTQASKSNKKTTSGTSGPSTSKLGNGGGEQDFLGL